MLRLDKLIKPWKESAALNDHINLYGFWNEMAFLTKSGDLGMILSVPGVDYESLDRSQHMMTRLSKRQLTSDGSSLKRSATISITLKFSTASCSKAPGRRPASARR